MPGERWITAEDMAQAEKSTKINRKNKLAAFTRKQKRLQALLDGNSTDASLKDGYAEVVAAYEVLEKAHEDLCLVLDEDHADADASYLDDPSDVLVQMQLKVDKLIQDREQSKKVTELETEKQSQFDSSLAALKVNIQNFGHPSTSLTQLSNAKTISFADMRQELEKLENSLSKLQEEKAKVVSLDPEADLTAVQEQFNSLVVDEVERCKRVALQYLKDAPAEPVTTSEAVNSGGGGIRATGFSTTKRETVMLPKFSGEEKTCFLKYPVWKQQWDSHITEYEPKYRATMLLNHLDDKALTQIIGLENDYGKAIAQLDKFYSDAKKVIKACLDEIRAHPVISAFDYKALVSYKKCLTNNYTRLKACDLEHEMSNTAALGVLVRKLPIQEAVKWQEFLAEQDAPSQTKPFPSFMQWLEKAGASWELLAASGTGAKSKGGTTQVHHSFFAGNDEASGSSGDKPCFKCGQLGHWKKNCTKGSPGRGGKAAGGGVNSSNGKSAKDRPVLKHKKYHCAYHKDAPGKLCSTWSCVALKYAPVEERLKLLKANGDC